MSRLEQLARNVILDFERSGVVKESAARSGLMLWNLGLSRGKLVIGWLADKRWKAGLSHANDGSDPMKLLWYGK